MFIIVNQNFYNLPESETVPPTTCFPQIITKANAASFPSSAGSLTFCGPRCENLPWIVVLKESAAAAFMSLYITSYSPSSVAN